MPWRRSRRVFGVLTVPCLLVLLLFCLLPNRAHANYKTVLVLHSYHPELRWNKSIQSAVEKVFASSGQDIVVQTEFMDSKRINDENHYANLLQLYRHKFSGRTIDAIISCDNNAFEFLLKYGQELFPGVPVVFCGVNDFDPRQIKDYPLMTGAVEAIDFLGGIDVALKVQPGLKRIYALGPETLTWQRNRALLEAAASKVRDRVEVVTRAGLNLSQAQELLKTLGPGDAVFIGGLFRDEYGEMLSSQRVVQELSKASAVPTYGLFDFQLGQGIVGGRLVSGRGQGETAAKMVLEVFAGRSVASLPVVTESANLDMFDYEQLERFGLDPERLPSGSVVINMPESFYGKYKVAVLGVFGLVLFLTTIIVALLINLRQRRKMHQQLKAKEEYYRTIFNAANDAMFLYDVASGEIFDVNEPLLRMFGVERENILGKQLGAMGNVDAGYGSAKVMQYVEKALSEGPQLVEWQGRKSTGEVFSCEAGLRAFDMENGEKVLAVVRNIEERKQAEETLRQQNALLESLFSAMPNPVYYKDAAGYYRGCNDRFAEDIVGWPREEVIGKHITEMTHTMSQDRIALHRSKDAELIAHGGVLDYECWVQHFSGEERYYHFYKASFDDSRGQVHGVIGMMLDVTEHRQAQKLQQQLIDELEDKNAELERFTYTVSHDLKSPIITIKGFAGMLENDLAKGNYESVRADLERINQAAERMSTLLDELLELSRIGRMINPMVEVQLGSLASEVMELLQGRLQKCHVQVVVHDNLPLVLVDKVRMQEVLQNLVDNAAKFTSNATSACIEVGMRQDGDEKVIYVSDNGIGIKPEYAQRVFNLFETLSPSGEGTGVGLALVKRIVELHGGRIWVESEGVGHGACFCFTLGPECWPG